MNVRLILISLIIFALGCSPSSEDDTRARHQFNDVQESTVKQESQAKLLAAQHNSSYVEPFSRQWSKKYTYQIQNDFEGKRIIFDTKLIDIEKTNNKYQFIFGGSYFSNTVFYLTSTSDVADKISKLKSKRFTIVATVNNIQPLQRNKSNGDPSDTSLNGKISGQSYLIKGTLDEFVAEKDPNN